MQINITGNHIDVTDPIKDYVHSKFQKIERHFQMINNVHVILSVDKKFQQKAEATLHVPQAEIQASSESEDLYAAIDLLIDKLDRQVLKHKEKMKKHNGE